MTLVEYLYNTGASHISEIDWRAVAKNLNGGAAKSNAHVKNTWIRLVRLNATARAASWEGGGAGVYCMPFY